MTIDYLNFGESITKLLKNTCGITTTDIPAMHNALGCMDVFPNAVLD